MVPILIVEDDEPTQRLLQTVLRHYGYSTETVSDGLDAIARLRTTDYILVVLDIMMPTVGGREVVEFLAAAGSSVPVIICSAAGPAALDGYDPAIVKAIVRKPFDVDELMAIVASAARPAPNEA